MNVRSFLDTNVWIYAYSDGEPEKRTLAYQLVDQKACVTSIQAFNEASNVWLRKFGWNGDEVRKHLDNIALACEEVLLVGRGTVNTALSLKDKYKFSYYDSLMLASALEGNCSVIYTEDMNGGQIIEGKLKIVNPFTE